MVMLETATLMPYVRGLMLAAHGALPVLWALDALLRLAGVAQMHAAAPVLGHNGVPNAPALNALMIQLLVSFVTIQLMRVCAKAQQLAPPTWPPGVEWYSVRELRGSE